MKALDTNLPSTSSRRGPVRMDTQDGPWSVSVAENPYDSLSYSLYIKTPTHNLTLTRAAMELVELDLKLRQAHPSIKIPALPINPDTLPTPPKRKSTFLNTLSRLASPTSSKSYKRNQNASSVHPTPLATPAKEGMDPFHNSDRLNASVTSNATPSSTAIAAYLTTVSNIPALRMDRLWKRFVRVRTDDLESVRVERAIKRVRSDLAAHTGIPTKEKENNKTGAAATAATNVTQNETENEMQSAAGEPGQAAEQPSGQLETHAEKQADGDAAVAASGSRSEIKEGEEVEVEEGQPLESANNATETTATATQSEQVPGDVGPGPSDDDAESTTTEAVEGIQEAEASESVPETPTATEAAAPMANRVHRSQSADPDKSHRLSRAFTHSVPSESGAETQTGDESSSSAANGKARRRRKKRSTSTSGTSKDKEKEPRKSQRKVVIDDFEMMRVLGKGCAGKVLLVRHKTTQDLFALKAITKRHVLAHQELQHTLTEQAVLKRMAAESRDPFVVKLWWSFHDKENLFLVMDFHPGGDLATQLARWGRLGRDRARFYAAEIVEGVEGLHAAGVIYRDLKPENILIGADGHIVLTDFGLSKEFERRNDSFASHSRGGEFYSSVPGTPQPATPPWMKTDKNGELALGWPGQPIGHSDTTTTFCGTAEYLAPEVIQGLPYSYEVDWWSFGTMLYEMLTGITPFWANNHSDMYVRVLQDELQFPDDRAIDQDTKSLIRGLLQRVPSLRICEPRIKKHPYFSMIDWSHVYYKRYIPPYIPPIDPSNASDTQNFDDTFLDMEPVLDDFNDEATDTDQEPQTDTDRTDGEETSTTPSQSRSSSMRPQQAHQPLDNDVDVFDGYSFKGRHSVLIDDEDEENSDEGSEESGSNEEEEDDELVVKAAHHQQQQQQQDAAEASSTSLVSDDVSQEEGIEPKTPEARPAALPPVVEAEPAEHAEVSATNEEPKEPESSSQAEASSPVAEQAEIAPTKRASRDVSSVTSVPVEPAAPASSQEASANGRTTPPATKVAPNRQVANLRGARSRREKSGVPALDRYLSDAVDEDTEVTEAEREEDDDWDFVEAADGEDRNGAKGTSLFARGVVDRYRLAVFRKASTPGGGASRNGQRSVSGMSTGSTATALSGAESPSPGEKKRGRNAGFNIRKNPRQFLRPKSPPPSSFNSKSARSISQSVSASNTMSAASLTSASAGLLSPSLSLGSNLNLGTPHSLKSKESAMSVGAQSHSSDQSNAQSAVFVDAADAADAIRGSPQSNGADKKTKKLKKYKNNAEKVFSIFTSSSSPRQS
ncbi:hypothetical protein CPC08DRAFT_635234 [Agrocybe pediades]|nr:hypothetical protein CPC08DRAFT_635234 [Agrocybe pediades]